MQGAGLEVGRVADTVPQPTVAIRTNLSGDRIGSEGSFEQVLQMVQVVLEEVAVPQQVLYQRDTGGPGARALLAPIGGRVARPVDYVGVLPLGAEVVGTEAVVVVPRYEGEVG